MTGGRWGLLGWFHRDVLAVPVHATRQEAQGVLMRLGIGRKGEVDHRQSHDPHGCCLVAQECARERVDGPTVAVPHLLEVRRRARVGFALEAGSRGRGLQAAGISFSEPPPPANASIDGRTDQTAGLCCQFHCRPSLFHDP